MNKVKKVILVSVTVLLLICFPITTVYAEVDWSYTYWQTVAANVYYYYNQTFKRYNRSVYVDNLGFVTYFDVAMSSIAYTNTYQTRTWLTEYIEYSYLSSNPGTGCQYIWWIPLDVPSDQQKRNDFIFTIAAPLNVNRYVASDGLEYNFVYGGNPLTDALFIEVQGWKTLEKNSAAEPISSVYIAEGLTRNISIPWQQAIQSNNNPYYDGTGLAKTFTVFGDALTDMYYLQIRLYWEDNSGVSGANYTKYVNPYTLFIINEENIVEEEETTGGSEEVDQVEEIAGKMDELINPSEEQESNVAGVESEFESMRDQFDEAMSEAAGIQLPDVESAIDDIFGPSTNPYDDHWLEAVFGGLWSNKFILQMTIFSVGFAMFGFVLYGKR